MTAWWYWAAYAVVLIVGAALGRSMWLTRRRDVRRDTIRHQRRAHFQARALWDIHRQDEYALALQLRRERLARMIDVESAAFQSAVRLAERDSRGADLLIAEATA